MSWDKVRKMQITKLTKKRFVKDELIGERAEYLTHYTGQGIIVWPK